MSYVSTKEILIRARKEKFVVGAFNAVDYTTIAAIVKAAKEKRSPVIVQTSQKIVQYFGYKILPEMIKSLAQDADVPVAMILDHGTDPGVIENCIKYGWSSVMIDASSYPFEKNIEITKKVVEMAHKRGVSVEGEIGRIGGKEEHVIVEENSTLLTDPGKAVEFQRKTGVDSLAVAIGTKHGLYGGNCELDFNRLGRIMELSDFPIVIHGCSDLPIEDTRRLVSYGPSKMNISTEIKHKYLDSYKSYIGKNPDEYEPVKTIRFVENEVKKLVEKFIDIFKSSNKA